MTQSYECPRNSYLNTIPMEAPLSSECLLSETGFSLFRDMNIGRPQQIPTLTKPDIINFHVLFHFHASFRAFFIILYSSNENFGFLAGFPFLLCLPRKIEASGLEFRISRVELQAIANTMAWDLTTSDLPSKSFSTLGSIAFRCEVRLTIQWSLVTQNITSRNEITGKSPDN